ncbi:MAG: 5-carboxymethyl-2-hydroxymuconate Delta-isomerase [Endozoicomonas sp.]
MPHCIIEYSQELEIRISISDLVSAVHQGAKASGLFAPEDIKTRATPYHYYQVAESSGTFVHITLRILSGRTPEQKLSLSQSVHKAAASTLQGVNSVSVEVLDIDSGSYKKTVT